MKQVEKLAKTHSDKLEFSDYIQDVAEMSYEIGFRTALELAAKKVNMNPDFTLYTSAEIYSQLLQIADREVG